MECGFDVTDNKKRLNSAEQQTVQRLNVQRLSDLHLSDHEPSEPTNKKAKTEYTDEQLVYKLIPDHIPVRDIPEFCDPPESAEKCTAGNHIAINPFTTRCGHTYCSASVETCKRLGVLEFTCTAKDDDSPSGDCGQMIHLDEMLKDMALEKAIKRKMVKCFNSNKGCKSEMTLREHHRHLTSVCDYTEVPCPNCNKKFQRRKLAKHQANCKSKACPLAPMGCKHVSESGPGTSTSTTPEHSTGLHLALIYQLLASVRDVAAFSAKTLNGALNSHTQATLRQEQITHMLTRPDEQEAASHIAAELKTNYSNKISDTTAARDRFRRMVHEDYPRRVAEPVLKCKRESEFLTHREAEKSETMKDFMKETLEAPILLNHGCVIFKIPNFSELRTKAIKGELKRGIYGPLFYTHEFGYLMIPIVYPNGDGAGSGTHLSVFIAIKKGKYDSLLHWPVVGRVSISILSQRKVGHESVSHSFKTDVASLSYHRPTNDMNQASGIPKALDLKLLKQPSDFLVDDTLFIQMVVEPSSNEK